MNEPNPIPTWPVAPTPYNGPTIGHMKGELDLTGGFGHPSAGMINIAGGNKSFGVLG